MEPFTCSATQKTNGSCILGDHCWRQSDTWVLANMLIRDKTRYTPSYTPSEKARSRKVDIHI